MAGLADIASAVADQIRTALDGVDSLAVQVEPRLVLVPNELTVDIYPPFTEAERDPDTDAFGEVAGGYILTVRARINTPDFEAAYDILIGLMDDEDALSIPNCLYDDPTLNGNAMTINLSGGTGLRAYARIGADGDDIGCQWTLLAVPAKS